VGEIVVARRREIVDPDETEGRSLFRSELGSVPPDLPNPPETA
jgi:hypothetical protein